MPLSSEVGQKRACEVGGRALRCSFVSVLLVHKMKTFVVICVALVGYITADVNCEEHNPYTEALEKRPWKSYQKYVEVRPGAFTFYWLYYADGTISGAERKPLIIWIQGGPGLAATGVANFAEIGPLTMEMKPRNHTWVKGRNVLLIDHPVGTGFSYVTDESLFVKTDRMMATDLTKTIRAFFRTHKEFRKTPTYIFGQSYGGKLCPRLAYYLHVAIEKKRLKMNLKGLGIGSGWVNPKESTLLLPNFLYNMGAIDQQSYSKCLTIVKNIADNIDRRNFTAATEWDVELYKITESESGININYNNINQPDPYGDLTILEKKINKYVKPTLKMVNQSMYWSYNSENAFLSLKNSLFVPSTKFLEMLLNKTQLNIAVFNGNLDVVTPLAGATNWVHKLRWDGAEEFRDAKRVPINGKMAGFYKKTGRFSFWGVFGAGHWVPEDSPVAMEQILEHVMSSND